MGSIAPSHYYPETSEGRAEWWENIQDHGEALLAAIGMPAELIASIMADAAWGVYSYGTLREAADRYSGEVARYTNAVAAGITPDPNHAIPQPPRPPKFMPPPSAEISSDIEHRRAEWVDEVKSNPAYSQEVGAALGIEPLPAIFNSGAYRAELSELVCTGPKTVTGRFRKAHGNIEGIVLRGRRSGSASWTELGRFKATPFSAVVPIPGHKSEEWEFQARALKRDIEMGMPSEIIAAMVRL